MTKVDIGWGVAAVGGMVVCFWILLKGCEADNRAAQRHKSDPQIENLAHDYGGWVTWED